MDIWDVLRAARRYWPLTFPLFAGLMVGTVALGQKAGSEYKATANTILLGPNTQLDHDPVTGAPILVNINPFFQGPDTDRLNRALALTVNDSSARLDMKAHGLSENLTVVPDNRGPLLLITVIAKTPELAKSTIDDALTRLQNELAKRQDSIKATSANRATLQLLSRSNPTTENGRKKRLFAAFGLVSVVLTLTVGVSLNAFSRRRRLRAAGLEDLDAVSRELREFSRVPEQAASRTVTGATRR